jgi:hypothetical protein
MRERYASGHLRIWQAKGSLLKPFQPGIIVFS